jgi:hypothetical protein
MGIELSRDVSSMQGVCCADGEETAVQIVHHRTSVEISPRRGIDSPRKGVWPPCTHSASPLSSPMPSTFAIPPAGDQGPGTPPARTRASPQVCRAEAAHSDNDGRRVVMLLADEAAARDATYVATGPAFPFESRDARIHRRADRSSETSNEDHALGHAPMTSSSQPAAARIARGSSGAMPIDHAKASSPLLPPTACHGEGVAGKVLSSDQAIAILQRQEQALRRWEEITGRSSTTPRVQKPSLTPIQSQQTAAAASATPSGNRRDPTDAEIRALVSLYR